MLCGAVAFASMASLAHALREDCAWPVIALARASVPLVLTGFLAALGGVPLVWRPPSLWVRSLAGSVSLTCTFFAFTRLPVSDVLTLTNLFPLWVALLAWPVLGQRPTAGVWLAVLMGLAGVVLIQQPHLAAGNFAALAAVAASLSSAVAMLGLHRLHGIDARAIVFHFSAVSMLFCFGLLAVVGDDAQSRPAVDWSLAAALVGIGLSATLGQFCLTKAFILGPPAKVSVVGLSQVAMGVIIDRLVWGRVFSPLTLAGIALVLLPTAWLLLSRREEIDVPA
jgi:drug/metabolite transporter (DMT)-like permease